MRGPGAGFKAGCDRAAAVVDWGMSAWNYLKAGFWQGVPLPLLGRVPLNAVAFAGFGVAGFDNPALWAVGAGWQGLWLMATAGRVGYRRKVDAAQRRTTWRTVEERRLQLYNQLPEADRLRHYTLRQKCQALLAPARRQEPEASAEIFTWLHLKLLLARHQALGGQARQLADPDLPRLHAGAAIDLTDPARSRLADEAVALLNPRPVLEEATQPLVPQLDEALRRIECELSALSPGAGTVDFRPLARDAAGAAAEWCPGTMEVDVLLGRLAAE